VIPFHFRQLCRSHAAGCYQSSFYKLNFKKAIPKEWYVQLSEEKSVKTTINIKKENIISAGRVIDMDKLVNKDFLQYYQKQSFYTKKNNLIF
jgi:hypothetical protein